MKGIALLTLAGSLLAGCGPAARIPPEPRVATLIRLALPEDPSLAMRLESAAKGVDGIVWVDRDEGAADVTAAYGKPVPEAGMTWTRIPAWDRNWCLELDPTARWVNDPTFRRWLAARIDRVGMARVLFGDDADPIPSGYGEPGGRPVSAGALPRLEIVRDRDNPAAVRIASRLRADLLPDRVLVEPSTISPDRATALRLLAYDPGHFGAEPDTVIPLVREHAYLLIREGLSGIVDGSGGGLSFRTERRPP